MQNLREHRKFIDFERFYSPFLKSLRHYLSMGPFNNYVTLKLPFFDQPTTRHHASSRMITRPLPLLSYVTPDTDPSLYHLFLFLEVEKKPKIRQRYAPNHDTFTHAFRQLNQIVRFK